MHKLMIAAAAALALALPATSVAKQPNPKSPAKACAALRAANEAAFKAQYRNFGACVSQHARARTRTPKAIKAQKNAARACLDSRNADPKAFADQWGKGRNAFGHCVSTTARQHKS